MNWLIKWFSDSSIKWLHLNMRTSLHRQKKIVCDNNGMSTFTIFINQQAKMTGMTQLTLVVQRDCIYTIFILYRMYFLKTAKYLFKKKTKLLREYVISGCRQSLCFNKLVERTIQWLSHKQSGVSVSVFTSMKNNNLLFLFCNWVNDSHIKTCTQKDSAVVLNISSQTNN